MASYNFAVIFILSSFGLVHVVLTQASQKNKDRQDIINCGILVECHALKGDIVRASTLYGDDPALHYGKAQLTLQKLAISVKNTNGTILATECEKEVTTCQDKLSKMIKKAYSLSEVPSCPEIHYSYLLFFCENFINWPKEILQILTSSETYGVNVRFNKPSDCYDQGSHCHMFEEITKFHEKNEKVLPKNWAIFRKEVREQ